ncbi:MAG: preprotein translocase subunit SecE [Candidatus Firestonebacteria bacterium]
MEIVDKISGFLKEVQSEMKKVSWPTRKDTLGSTTVVVVVVLILALFIGLTDGILSKIMELLVK